MLRSTYKRARLLLVLSKKAKGAAQKRHRGEGTFWPRGFFLFHFVFLATLTNFRPPPRVPSSSIPPPSLAHTSTQWPASLLSSPSWRSPPARPSLVSYMGRGTLLERGRTQFDRVDSLTQPSRNFEHFRRCVRSSFPPPHFDAKVDEIESNLFHQLSEGDGGQARKRDCEMPLTVFSFPGTQRQGYFGHNAEPVSGEPLPGAYSIFSSQRRRGGLFLGALGKSERCRGRRGAEGGWPPRNELRSRPRAAAASCSRPTSVNFSSFSLAVPPRKKYIYIYIWIYI